MAENKRQLTITIGAALSKGFNSTISNSTAQLKGVGGVVKNLEQQSINSAKALTKMQTNCHSLLTSVDRQQKLIEKRDAYRSKIMGMMAIGASLIAPIKYAMDFETSLSNIAAVVNFPEPDGLKKLGDTLTHMSLSIPKTAEELASIAAIGGSFQVPLKDLTKFTEEVAKTAVAWRANSDETAQRVGNMMKVFNVETAQLSEYFDAFNDLGNKAGASADSILKGVNKASGGLANFKIALPQAAALTSTIISFGENAETAGAQVSTMLQRLSIAPKLGADAQKALHTLGLSSVTLPKMIQEDPNKALDTIFNALEKLDPENRATVMYSIFGRGASATVGKLVNNLDLYRKNLQIVANAKTLKGSRDGDYNIVMGTLGSKLSLLRNSFSSLLQKIGNALIPVLSSLSDWLIKILDKFDAWITKNKTLFQVVVKFGTGLLVARAGMFGFGYAFSFLRLGFGGLVTGIKLVRLGFVALLGVGAKIAAEFRNFSGNAGELGSLLKDKFINALEGAKGALSDLLVASKRTLAPLWNDFKEVFNMDQKGLGFSSTGAVKSVAKVGTTMAVVGKTIQNTNKTALTTGNYSQFFKELQGVFHKGTQINSKLLKEEGIKLWTVAKKYLIFPIYSILSNVFVGVKNVVKDVLLPAFKEFLIGIKEIMPAFKAAVVPFGVIGASSMLFYRVMKLISKLSLKGFLTGLKIFGIVAGGAIRTVWFLAKFGIPLAISAVIILGRSFWFIVSEIIPLLWRGLGALIGVLSSVKTAIFSVVRAVGSMITVLWNSSKVMRIFMASSGILLFIGAAYLVIKHWDQVKGFFVNLWEGIKVIFKKGVDAVKQVFDGLWQGVELSGYIGKFLSEVVKNANAVIKKVFLGENVEIPIFVSIKKFFTDFWDENVVKKWDEFVAKIHEIGLVDDVINAWKKVQTFFTNFIDLVKPKIEGFLSPIKTLWDSISKVAGPKVDKLMEPVKGLWNKLTGGPSPEKSVALNKTTSDLAKSIPVNSQGRTQNNNFEIVVNANSGENGEVIARKVTDKMSQFSKAFLFDEGVRAI